jgi:hypothetical protein
VKITPKILFALGLAINAAQAISNTGLANCGGLFLLHLSDKQFSAKSCSIRDSLTVDNFNVYGAFEHIAIQGRYTDHWHIKGLNKQNIVSAGFESHYKNVSLGVNVNSAPFVQASFSAYRQDSLFKASASIARGSLNFGTIRWIPEKENGIINTIAVDWESHIFYSKLSAESKIDNHYIDISLSYAKTSPHNPDKAYYVRDSANVIALSGGYGHAFKKSRLNVGYTFTDADITLYGIYHSEDSRKRFMYLPLDATMHLGFVHWDWERLRTHMEFMHAAGRLRSNPNRFFETLAPNRALPASVIKGLSFSFLQKAFRIDADLDASAILGGASYRWKLGSRYVFKSKVELDLFGASGEINIDKQIETTVMTSHRYEYEKTLRKLNSIGSVLSVDFEINKVDKNSPVIFALEYGFAQIIPFYIDYKDYNVDKPNESSTGNKTPGKPSSGSSGSNNHEAETKAPKDKAGSLDGNISSLIFRNGFATHLGISIRF